MADFRPLNGDAITAQVWGENTLDEARKDLVLSKEAMIGTVVMEHNDLMARPGDTVNVPIKRIPANFTVKTGYSTLEGEEGSTNIVNQAVSVDLRRGGFSEYRPLAQQRVAFSTKAAMDKDLKDELGEDIEGLKFTALYAATNSITAYTDGGTDVLYHSTPATALAAVAAVDILRPSTLRRVRPFLTTGNQDAMARIKPVKVPGYHRPVFIVVQHPNALVDLKENSEYAQYIREAELRGKDNPFFSGAVAVIDGFIIFESEFVTLGSGESSASVSQGFILGESALAWAWAGRPVGIEQTTDYIKESRGWMYVGGCSTVNDNSKPFGHIRLYCGTGANYAGTAVS